jgi:hypothetical protein
MDLERQGRLKGESTVDLIVVCRTAETEVWEVEGWVSHREVQRLVVGVLERCVLGVSLMPSSLSVALSLSARNR